MTPSVSALDNEDGMLPDIEIPAGTDSTDCANCGRPVYLVPRLSGVRMAVEVLRDEHIAPTGGDSGIGVAHLFICPRTGRRKPGGA